MSDFRFRAAVAVLAVLGGLTVCRLLHPNFAAEGLDADWDAAARRSRELRQPAMLLFTADWCPACQSLHAETMSNDRVREELYSHYVFHAVDLTHASAAMRAQARRFDVKSIPTMIRYDAEGRETSRAHYMGAEAMVEWLKAGE